MVEGVPDNSELAKLNAASLERRAGFAKWTIGGAALLTLASALFGENLPNMASIDLHSFIQYVVVILGGSGGAVAVGSVVDPIVNRIDLLTRKKGD